MKKQTLQFLSLRELTLFSKTLQGGYLINTSNYTLIAKLHELQVNVAMELYYATVVEITNAGLQYDLV